MYKKSEIIFSSSPGGLSRPRQVLCALCGEELYPGDRYFALDGRKICDRCLEEYARRYFAGDLRRVSTERGGGAG